MMSGCEIKMPSNTKPIASPASRSTQAPGKPSKKALKPADYLKKILTARVYDVAVESALEPAKNLSLRLNNTVLLKREDQQPVFSFKLRGAYNKMAHLSAAQLKKGVICASAGNHAQGVALSAQKLGTRAVIVMPTTTPQVKMDAAKSWGGEVMLHGDCYSDTDAVCAAIKDVFVDTRSIVEPAGALAVAAIKQYVATHKTKGESYAAILCGANMNFDRLRFVAERAEVGEEREALFAVTIPEERGSFRHFCELIGELPGGPRSVTEFNYRVNDAAEAHVFVGLTTSAKGESSKIAAKFSRHGFKALDLTHDELAKEHIRHMVGGHSALSNDERLLRFIFPERPGALMKFLSLMRPGWNIT